MPSLLLFSALYFLLDTRRSGCIAADNVSTPAPISYQPSNYWDGNDGAWSTFAFQIGTPPQAVRLLPSITGNSIWTVWSYACIVYSLANCPSARGDVFNISASTTWDEEGNYSLPLNPQHYLPYTGGAVVGFDNTTLDWQGHGGSSLSHQVIFAYATNDFFLGSIGLHPESINISSYNDQIPSVVGSLRDENLIPSTSWGYLAGASYYSYPVSGYGSLTFGGYDASRLNIDKNLTLAGGSDPYRTFLLGIENINSEGKELLAEPVIAALDSRTSQIWLPIPVCQAFEAAFGLVWDADYELYLLNEEQHSTLLARNASITFSLSTGISNSTERLDITLPYAAFDLKASPPLAGNQTQYYFPLKQASNDTQITLGRTILQEIYMIADYDRGMITLYEAAYPESSVKSNIITICPPESTTCFSSTSVQVARSHKLSTAATAGIIIAALVVAAICVVIWFKFFRNKQPLPESGESLAAVHTVGMSNKPELDGEGSKTLKLRKDLPPELEGYWKPENTDSVRDSGYNSASTRKTEGSSLGVSSPARLELGVSESGGAALQELSAGNTTTSRSTNPSELLGSITWPSK